MLDDRFEQRPQIVGGIIEGDLRDTGPRIRIDNREFELLLGGIEVDEQIVKFVNDFLDSGIGPSILLITAIAGSFDQGPSSERIESGERSFAGVHQRRTPSTIFRALNLPAKIAVAGCVDDVDLHAVVANTSRLGKNRDSPLPLKIVGIEHAFHDFFISPENPALTQHGVNQGRLAVVHMRDDRYVANVVIRHDLP